MVLGALSVVTGVAIWKPVQLSWLTAAFGGFQLARYWHFWAVWAFVAFAIMHVILVFVADPASLRAMLTGRYRGRYVDNEP
jgi:thiosulfate reductase cytochrome b subunit